MTNSISTLLDFQDDDITSSPDRAVSEDNPETIFFTSIADALTTVAPQGSVVRTVGIENTDELLRMGYRVNKSDEPFADITLARGGMIEFDIARKIPCRKLILVPTHDYAAAATTLYRTTDEAFAVVKRGQKPFAAVFDSKETDGNLAAVFGEIAALDLAAFDFAFGAYMRGDCVDTAIVTEVAELVSALTAKLKAIGKNVIGATQAIIQAGEKCARIIEREPRLLFASGATQIAEALRMLYIAEERSIGMRGELEMSLGSILIDFYIKCQASTRFEFPPDNNKRIDSICEYFNVDIRRACVYAAALYPPIKMRLCEYRRQEFRHEQMRMLVELRSRHIAAVQVFKRLYPDDGFGLKNLIDPTDIGLCLALAPDVFSADSMLSFLKQAGRLERYII